MRKIFSSLWFGIIGCIGLALSLFGIPSIPENYAGWIRIFGSDGVATSITVGFSFIVGFHAGCVFKDRGYPYRRIWDFFAIALTKIGHVVLGIPVEYIFLACEEGSDEEPLTEFKKTRIRPNRHALVSVHHFPTPQGRSERFPAGVNRRAKLEFHFPKGFQLSIEPVITGMGMQKFSGSVNSISGLNVGEESTSNQYIILKPSFPTIAEIKITVHRLAHC